MPEGFGRVLDASGEYYIGQYKDTLRHGHGKFVTSTGVVQQGRWADDEFIGPWNSIIFKFNKYEFDIKLTPSFISNILLTIEDKTFSL